MFKRLFWFGSGAATGAYGSFWVKRRIQQRLARLTPKGVRDRAIQRAGQVAADAKIAYDETRAVIEARRHDRQ